MVEFHRLDLLQVEKPVRYIGGEIGSVHKTPESMTRFCFAFPDLYEIGMSHLGMHLMYQRINELSDVFCERCFMPWTDFRAQLIEKNIDLHTIETKTSLRSMDFLGFTLQYELSFTNILEMLRLAHIPLLASERKRRHMQGGVYPIVVAGGPCAFNPEPIADFIDLFFIGESEELIEEFLDLARRYDRTEPLQREEFLLRASELEGIYVPRFYEPVYDGHGDLTGYLRDGRAAAPIRKRIVKDVDGGFQLTAPIVPFSDIVHDRAVAEIFRGCTRGCRFCQAGMIYRPVREKSVETVMQNIDALISNSGYDEVSLSSLSTLDYARIEELVSRLCDKYGASRTSVSLPSLRMDAAADDLSIRVLNKLQSVRKSGLTFAPEAGTQRLRDVINKNISERDIEETFRKVFALGWFRVKLYFMIGLPTETDLDLKGIEEIANLAVYLYKQVKPETMKKLAEVSVSASCFVPKPFTPFQWMPQETVDRFYDKIDYLRSCILNKRVAFQYHDPKTSWLEGVFARGDRRLAPVLRLAVQRGICMDGWQEFFDFDRWMEVFRECGVDPAYYNERERSYDEYLPWDIIDAGVDKEFLRREHERSLRGETTADCREGCRSCGILKGVMTEGCPCLR